ncbi:MAG: chorismate synthase [Thermodesulfobacteriota bacterium]
MLRYLTAGESHGKALIAILCGVPSNLTLSRGYIDRELSRRQLGYGRGERMAIEKDRVEIISGVRFGVTIASPIAISIKNVDWENWKDTMAVDKRRRGVSVNRVTRPRPGHADLSGAMKYEHEDIRNVLERSSARETAARVAVGAVCKRFLEEFEIRVLSWVEEIGGVSSQQLAVSSQRQKDITALFKKAEISEVRCPEKKATEEMKKRIDEARSHGDSLGGIFKVVVTGVPPGLGSYVQWDKKLDGRLAQVLMSIQAVKGVEVGMGFGVSSSPGSKVHDEIFFRSKGSEVSRQRRGRYSRFWPIGYGFYRKTNNAGGIEGGMSNGEPIIMRAAMKPIPTLYKPLRSVDIVKRSSFQASVERSDICAVPAAAVIGEAVVAFEIANLFLEKFGGDSITEVKRNYRGYLNYLRKRS